MHEALRRRFIVLLERICPQDIAHEPLRRRLPEAVDLQALVSSDSPKITRRIEDEQLGYHRAYAARG